MKNKIELIIFNPDREQILGGKEKQRKQQNLQKE